MKDNRAACIRISGGWEGGYSNHPADRGGETYRGVILAVWRAYLTRKGQAFRAITTMTEDEYQEIFTSQYWHPVHGDVLAYGVDLSVFDYGLNSGPGQSIKDLQRVVKVKADGVIGNLTLQAVEQATLTASASASVIREHCERRVGLLNGIISRKPSQVVFKKGWMNRVADIEVKGVGMTVQMTEQHATNEAESAEQRATTLGNKGTAAGGAAGTVDAAVASTTDINIWIVLGLIGVAIFGSIMLWKYLHARSYQKARAVAYYSAAVVADQEVANGPVPTP